MATPGADDAGDPVEARSPRSNLALAVVLALVAGCVDAISFERVFAVFPANQSGNAALLGIDLGQRHGGDVWRPTVAILGFGIGIAVAIVAGSRFGPRRRAQMLLGAEVLLLVPLLLVVIAERRPIDELGAVAGGCLLAVTAGAMGLQTEVIGRVAGTAVATTYQTGAITHIAESTAARIAPRRPGQTVAKGATILVLVLAAYVGGAALGAALGTWRFSVVVPVLVLAASTAVVSVSASRAP